MKAFLDRACDLMRQAGATYGDVRIRQDRKEEVNVKDGRPEHIATERFAGFGVRVIVDGAFDFVDGNADQSPPRLYRVVSP